MYIFEVDAQESLKDVVIENLKILGVRGRLPKKPKDEKDVVYSENQTFQKPINLLPKCLVNRMNGSTVEIPIFLADACNVIEREIKTEGIFRRAGSTCKQRESKLELNQGKKLGCDYHVFDACNLVKLFFRELPQPIIPTSYNEIFLKCLLLPTRAKQVEALMLACLLIPIDNLATLAFFMEFLLKVSRHADQNKMDVKNLAIILTPTLMPVTDANARAPSNLKISHHFKVIEILIENAEKVARVPNHISDCLTSVETKKKKKQRSGSITRMFTGLKKMVGSRGSTTPEWDDSNVSTPGSMTPLGKRKASNSNDPFAASGLSASKKKRIADVLPDAEILATPVRCRMNGYITHFDGPIPANLKRVSSESPPRKSQRKLFASRSSAESNATDSKGIRVNIVRRRTTKKQKSGPNLGSAASTGNLVSGSSHKTSLERRLSIISWGKRKTSFLNKSEPICESISEDSVDVSGSEMITVHKREYEDIKNRVSALEEELEMMNAAHSVQTAYEKTLEEAERINDGSTEHLARRLSKELKIRRSLENKVIRSPSARKIGSIRRRSKELTQKQVEQKTNLKRGRPNTLQTGLPSPGTLRVMSQVDLSKEKVHQPKTRSSSFKENEEWNSGEAFFAREHLLQKLMPSPQGRPSIAEIRFHNAGMVLEKAKLFNSLNQSGESDKSKNVQRRQSVRLENLRRMSDSEKSAKKPTVSRTRSLGTGSKKSKDLLGDTKENEIRSLLQNTVLTPDLKETIYEICTPFSQKMQTPLKENNRITVLKNESIRRQTPAIKKCLGTRSPRQFPKTPISQARSTSKPRPTPMRALHDTCATPHRGLRRSPRILARSISTSTR